MTTQNVKEINIKLKGFVFYMPGGNLLQSHTNYKIPGN
jgi:hypothetical protein